VDPATKTRLLEGAGKLGVILDEPALTKLDRYLGLLLQWNRRINLTAITAPDEIVERHFLDSLAVAPLLAGVQTLVDIGSGGGFPGAVLAAVRPDLRVTAVDSIRKKVAFLETLRMEILPNLEPLTARHSDLIEQRRTFDAAVSRATWDPAQWVREGAPLVRPDGFLIAMRTSDQPAPSAPPGFEARPERSYFIERAARFLSVFQKCSTGNTPG